MMVDTSRAAFLALALTGIGSAALAQEAAGGKARIEGPAEVVEGDVIRLGVIAVGLYGIDAPAIDETCTSADGPWSCGYESSQALARLVAGQTVRCDGEDSDASGRALATCYLEDGTDIGRAHVGAGWALADRNATSRYLDDERGARESGLGIWKSLGPAPEPVAEAPAAPEPVRAAAPAPVETAAIEERPARSGAARSAPAAPARRGDSDPSFFASAMAPRRAPAPQADADLPAPVAAPEPAAPEPVASPDPAGGGLAPRPTVAEIKAEARREARERKTRDAAGLRAAPSERTEPSDLPPIAGPAAPPPRAAARPEPADLPEPAAPAPPSRAASAAGPTSAELYAMARAAEQREAEARAEARREAAAERESDERACRIKGDISQSLGRIYYAPGQADYDKAVIDVSRGERWFCSEEEARIAGWKRARR